MNPLTAKAFNHALDAFARHDRAGDWSDKTCSSVAQAFVAAARLAEKENRAVPEAHYDAALAHERCDQRAEARAELVIAAKLDPEFYRARAKLALYEFEETRNVDEAIRVLSGIIREAKFQNVEALVALASLQMERKSAAADDDGKGDMERARKNLQRALAIDDSYMAAENQLAIFYLEQAKAHAGTRARSGLVASSSKKRHPSSQELNLAALVASQGILKNPNYAPLYNTAGLIQVELGSFNSAVKSFQTARRLDPKLFEAHVNYAAVNLGFRGFEEAELAYRDALRVRPDDYEAKLGLALALRGQIRPGDPTRLTARVEKTLEEAKQIAPERPETYYNQAILTHEYKAKGDKATAVPALRQASKLFQEFIAKAGTDPALADAVRRAKERSEDIAQTIVFIERGP